MLYKPVCHELKLLKNFDLSPSAINLIFIPNVTKAAFVPMQMKWGFQAMYCLSY